MYTLQLASYQSIRSLQLCISLKLFIRFKDIMFVNVCYWYSTNVINWNFFIISNVKEVFSGLSGHSTWCCDESVRQLYYWNFKCFVVVIKKRQFLSMIILHLCSMCNIIQVFKARLKMFRCSELGQLRLSCAYDLRLVWCTRL